MTPERLTERLALVVLLRAVLRLLRAEPATHLISSLESLLQRLEAEERKG